MVAKYKFALRDPWLPVVFDPPEPQRIPWKYQRAARFSWISAEPDGYDPH